MDKPEAGQQEPQEPTVEPQAEPEPEPDVTAAADPSDGGAGLKEELEKVQSGFADKELSYKLALAGCINEKAAKAMLDGILEAGTLANGLDMNGNLVGELAGSGQIKIAKLGLRGARRPRGRRRKT